MLTQVNPKLPMRSKAATKAYYTQQLGFTDVSAADYDGYLIVEKDNVQLHFFSHPALNPNENYGQVYIRTDDVVSLGNVRKNGWWIFGKRFIKYSRNPEEDASSAGEQLASNKDYHL